MTQQDPLNSSIYLILPRTLNQGVLRHLQEILETNSVACILAQKSNDGVFDRELLKAFIEMIQGHNVACVLENDVDLAKELGADGVHLTDGLTPDEDGDGEEEESTSSLPVYDKARAVLGDDAIIGGLCNSRHVAMVLGEQGAQYVALPAETGNDAELTAHEQIQWWCELFELPCVAWDIKNTDDIEMFKTDGADFLAFGDVVWNADDPVKVMGQISEKL